MASYADGLIALWDGESPGTLDMISKMIGRREVWIELIKHPKDENFPK